MEYVRTEDGAIKADEKGNPLVQNEGEDPFGLDAIHLFTKIPALNEEAKSHRQAREAIESEYNEFKERYKGIEDPNTALKALDTLKNLDAKKLVDAGEIDTLQRQLSEGFESDRRALTDTFNSEKQNLTEKLKRQEEAIRGLMVDTKFASSDFLRQKTNMTPDVAALVFGRHFKVEDINGKQKAVAYLENGEKVYSRSKHGDLADFDEAFAILWDKYPNKDQYTRTRSGGPDTQSNLNGSHGDAIVLNAAQKRDPVIYRQARERAKKLGVPLQLQ